MPPVRWLLPVPDPAAAERAAALSRALQIPVCLGQVLTQRGYSEPAAVQAFLNPKLSLLGDPFDLPDMEAAVARILLAVDRGERIVLYGDYDVDGVTSLAILAELLSAYGAKPACFLPMRVEEGYGLSADGIARCVKTLRPEFLIALDCGTASAGEIASLVADGVEVAVVDHHEPQHELPRCAAVVNPKRGKGHHYLCTAGLVFKVCHALLKRRPLPGFDLRRSLDLVALGTVADLVPLTGENRTLVRHGSREIERTRRPGLRALLDVAGVQGPISTGDIGFKLGPRLNAAGRLGVAQAALELLMTPDPERARVLAAELDAQNRERRNVEQATLLEAEAQIAALWASGGAGGAAIVVGAAGWHPGVLGIVASRLMRTHHRPALVIGFDEAGVGKGSGRSIEGLSLVGALGQCAQWLDRFGGHEMAAGLTMRQTAFADFQRVFGEVARALLSDEQLQPFLRLDAELNLTDVDVDFLGCHEMLQPFGAGNPQPLFLARQVMPAAEPLIMKGKHLRLSLRQRTARAGTPPARAVFFNGAAQPLPPPPWDVAFKVEGDEYRGETRVQVQVQAVREAAAA